MKPNAEGSFSELIPFVHGQVVLPPSFKAGDFECVKVEYELTTYDLDGNPIGPPTRETYTLVTRRRDIDSTES